MVAKIKKLIFAKFGHTVRAWVVSNAVEDTLLRQFLLISVYSFDFIFLF